MATWVLALPNAADAHASSAAHLTESAVLVHSPALPCIPAVTGVADLWQPFGAVKVPLGCC